MERLCVAEDNSAWPSIQRTHTVTVSGSVELILLLPKTSSVRLICSIHIRLLKKVLIVRIFMELMTELFPRA